MILKCEPASEPLHTGLQVSTDLANTAELPGVDERLGSTRLPEEALRLARAERVARPRQRPHLKQRLLRPARRFLSARYPCFS